MSATTTFKEEAHRLIDLLPDDATWEDLQYQIYFRQAVEAGLVDSQVNKVVPLEEARKQFGLKPQIRIRCEAVKYRQGFIEVIGGIHSKLVNIETWQVTPEVSIEGLDVGSEELDGRDFVANTELELTPSQARLLAKVLTSAANTMETKPTLHQNGTAPNA